MLAPKLTPKIALPRVLRLAGPAKAPPAPDHLDIDVRLLPRDENAEDGRRPPLDGAPEPPRSNPRRASAREIAQLAMDLYLDGTLGFEDSAMLGFQPDLNRRFAQTIGSLTEEPALPDALCDYVALWEEHLAFERQYNPAGRTVHERMARIIGALRQLAGPSAAARSAAE